MRALFLSGSVLSALALGCAPAAPVVPDADGSVDGRSATTCASDAECDDGVFCNGEELCLPRSPLADARGCAVEGSRCAAGEVCDEAMDRCGRDCVLDGDRDGDGEADLACGGLDCDDMDPARAPGNAETCDAADVDEDCDPSTFGARDLDGDTYLSASCCNGAGAERRCGDDCDDTNVAVHPTEAETCNGLDDDCNGATDEGVLVRYVVDADRDGHGSATVGAPSMDACRAPAGYAESADDCDDAVASVHPGAYDRCDGGLVDDDCSGASNDPPGGCSCADGDSRTCPLPGACGRSTQTCVAGVWPACAIVAGDEICANGEDDDCDGAVDDGCECAEDYRFCGSDVGECERGIQLCANDGSWGPCAGAVEPAPETCNMLDDDCDGASDEGVFVRCFGDTDRDGYSVLAAPMMSMCATRCPDGFTTRDPSVAGQLDCAPDDARAHPGQTAGFATPRTGVGGFDFDCNGAVVITDTILSGCVDDGTGGCFGSSGLSGTGACGARRTYIVCASIDMGSSGRSCEQVYTCLASSVDCGDQNQIHCR